jgi:fumarylacetoacetate (FAA) hydrolase family protein
MAKLADDLPQDWRDALLVGRIALPAGPTPVLVRGGRVIDISRFAATTAEALAQPDVADAHGEDLGALDQLDFRLAWESASPGQLELLSPVDLQCIKASGVTFAVSAVERVIEERARGDFNRANEIRESLAARVGADLKSVKPGSEQAMALKEALIFTKAPVLSSVGWGAWIGVRSDSVWNNPEPEVVIICDPGGKAVGAALGNDVNLRCIEGRSALLLGKAKDNNASAAIGPFIRLFDGWFTMDDVRRARITLEVRGEDGFVMTGASSMNLISRDPLDLVGQTYGAAHQYPDGFALYLGTMFAPIDDRDTPGKGFTHKMNDDVRVASERLGALRNRVTTSEQAPPWTLGVLGLMQNLASRGLLKAA